jgi:hypothetical protein
MCSELHKRVFEFFAHHALYNVTMVVSCPSVYMFYIRNFLADFFLIIFGIAGLYYKIPASCDLIRKVPK